MNELSFEDYNMLGTVLDYLYDLQGEWQWKENEVAGLAVDYADLGKMIEFVKMRMNNETLF